MSLLRRLASLVCVGAFAFFSLATAKAPPQKVPPTLQMSTDVPNPVFLAQHRAQRGHDCTSALAVSRGGVPAHADALVNLRLAGDEAVPYSFFAEALQERAQKYCGDGLSILSAEPSSKSSGFDAVNAVVWVKKKSDVDSQSTSEKKLENASVSASSSQKAASVTASVTASEAGSVTASETEPALSLHRGVDGGVSNSSSRDAGVTATEKLEQPDAF